MPVPDNVESRDAVTPFIARLFAQGRVAVDESPVTAEAAISLGLRRDGGCYALPSEWDPLDSGLIRGALGARAREWLRDLEIVPATGSTNADLVSRGQQQSIAGQVRMAEVQLAGRGRRGRTWFSPLGGNLALTLGFEAGRPPAELGGFSLVVGLAVMDALEAVGIAGLALKWPNDVLLSGAKVGGILIELVARGSALDLVVGVGLNIRLPEPVRGQLDQSVTDLASTGIGLPSRSELAARLISTIVDMQGGFIEAGFAPFAPIFDAHHAYQGSDVLIRQGEGGYDAHVLGVALDGGLRVSCAAGVKVVHGGEVSLRAHSSRSD